MQALGRQLAGSDAPGRTAPAAAIIRSPLSAQLFYPSRFSLQEPTARTYGRLVQALLLPARCVQPVCPSATKPASLSALSGTVRTCADMPARPPEVRRNAPLVVDEAIARYHAEGLDSTLDYYSSPDSVDAQWYVFIATPDGSVLGHYNAEDLGSHLEEMLDDGSFTATEAGIWVTYEDVNPVTGEVEDKHFWLVEHDGLVFGSGWHHDANRVAREGLPTPGQLIPTLWAGSVSGRRSGSALWERPCVDAHPPSQRTHRGAQPPSLDCCLSWQT